MRPLYRTSTYNSRNSFILLNIGVIQENIDIYNSRNSFILLNIKRWIGMFLSTIVEILLYYLTYGFCALLPSSTIVEILLYYLTYLDPMLQRYLQ